MAGLHREEPQYLVSVGEYRVPAGQGLSFLEEVQESYLRRRAECGTRGEVPMLGVALALEDADFVVARAWTDFDILEAPPPGRHRTRERGWAFRVPRLQELRRSSPGLRTHPWVACEGSQEQARWRLDAVMPGIWGTGLHDAHRQRPWWSVVHLGLAESARRLRPEDLARQLIDARDSPLPVLDEGSPRLDEVRLIPLLGLDSRAELAVVIRASTLETVVQTAIACRQCRSPADLRRPAFSRSRTVVGLRVGAERAGSDTAGVVPLTQSRGADPGDPLHGFIDVGGGLAPPGTLPAGYRLLTEFRQSDGPLGPSPHAALLQRLSDVLGPTAGEPRDMLLRQHVGYRDLMAEVSIAGWSTRDLALTISRFAGLADLHPRLPWSATESSISIDWRERSTPAEASTPRPESDHAAGASPRQRPPTPLLDRWTAATARQSTHKALRRLVAATLDDLERSLPELPALLELMGPAKLIVDTAVEASQRSHAPPDLAVIETGPLAHWVAGIRRRMLEQIERSDPLVGTRRASRGADQPLGPALPRLALSRLTQELAIEADPKVCPLVRWTVDTVPRSEALSAHASQRPVGWLLRCPSRLWLNPIQYPVAAAAVADAMLRTWRLEDLVHAMQQTGSTGAYRTADTIHADLEALCRWGKPNTLQQLIRRMTAPLAADLRNDTDTILARVVARTLGDVVAFSFVAGFVGFSGDPELMWWALGPLFAHELRWGSPATVQNRSADPIFDSLGPTYGRLLLIELVDQIVRAPGQPPPGPEALDHTAQVLGEAAADHGRARHGTTQGVGHPARHASRLLRGVFPSDATLPSMTWRGKLVMAGAGGLRRAIERHPEHWQTALETARSFHHLGAALADHRRRTRPGSAASLLHRYLLRLRTAHNEVGNQGTYSLGGNVLEFGRGGAVPTYGLDGRLLLSGPDREARILRETYHRLSVDLMVELGRRHIESPIGWSHPGPLVHA